MPKEATDHEEQHTRDYSAALAASDRFYADVHREMIAWLEIPTGSRVLDAGCGAGGVTALLAGAVGSDGSVDAIDIAPAHVAATRHLVETTSYAGRVTYHEGGFPTLPFPENHFDLVWCSQVIHHMPDQVACLRDARRVLRPGGRLALREGGLRMKFLQGDIGIGEPGLEQRLEALTVRWLMEERRSGLSGGMPYHGGWTAMLRDAGFQDVTARGFLLERLPPFDDEDYAYLERGLRTWLEDPRFADLPSAEDRETIAALTDPESPHSIRRRVDLHVLAVSTVYLCTTT